MSSPIDFAQAKQEIDKALDNQQLLLVVGNCSVEYKGRAVSKLAEGDRLVIIKGDGSFLVHQNKNLAAINYQPPKGVVSCTVEDNTLVLQATRRKPVKEQLKANFTAVYSVQAFPMKDDSSLKLYGSEKDLSNELMKDLEMIEKGLRPVKQESHVLKGYIDISAIDRNGNNVVIEVKRRNANLDAVSQLKRYVSEIAKIKDKKVRGILCAPGISSNALAFLEKEGFQFFKMEYEIHNPRAEIKGLQRKQKELKEFL